ncbi:MAG: hypothetical protein H7Z37_01905 [Pyrinomonadaceae bacterium]|nr:hypothetical protein [Pyrinomonadaceae bacterium]
MRATYHLKMVFTDVDYPNFIALFFQRTPSPDDNFDKIELLDDDKTDFSRIRCPHCKWQPKSFSRWMCASGGFPEFYFEACGTSWNTFETRGICPTCNHKWRYTSCLRCDKFSLHEDWYEIRDE